LNQIFERKAQAAIFASDLHHQTEVVAGERSAELKHGALASMDATPKLRPFFLSEANGSVQRPRRMMGAERSHSREDLVEKFGDEAGAQYEFW